MLKNICKISPSQMSYHEFLWGLLSCLTSGKFISIPSTGQLASCLPDNLLVPCNPQSKGRRRSLKEIIERTGVIVEHFCTAIFKFLIQEVFHALTNGVIFAAVCDADVFLHVLSNEILFILILIFDAFLTCRHLHV